MCTMEGGLVVTDDGDLYHIMLSMRSHGWLREQPENSKLYIDGLDDFDKAFKFVLPGYNLRPIEMEGALGSEQLKKLPAMIKARQDNGDIWSVLMENNANYKVQKNVCKSSWFGFSVILKNSLLGRRKEVIKALTSAGVEVRPIVAGNFLRNPVIKYLEHSVSGDMTVADEVHDNGLFIGNHHFDVTDKLKEIIDILNNLSEV